MRRELPPEPHLDHLKKQAKALLDAHRRGAPEALARIRAALPAFAGLSDDDAARAPFALHDAQSAIAREYGCRSWNELRAEVAKRRADPLSRAVLTSLMAGHPNAPLPALVTDAIRDAWIDDPPGASDIAVPATLPLLAVRNAVVLPGSVAPLHVGRAASLAAVDAAVQCVPPLLAVFAQRRAEVEDVSFEALHTIGCLVLVHRHVPDDRGRLFLIIRGLRWIALEALAEPSGDTAHWVAHVSEAPRDDGAPEDMTDLAASLRERARRLAGAMPERERLLALIDAIEDPERLGNLLVANLPCSVDDKARYASEPRLADKLRIAIALCDDLDEAPPQGPMAAKRSIG